MPSVYRFPLFFIGVMIIITSGILNKLSLINVGYVEDAAVLGFAIIVLSIAG
ncbi:MAG: hypothetical protein M1156_00745 [Candidatus Marsarchaeota archaeon]|jgi:hypothetical protein|nr:hypothetical protein [Candidatus Marsarchaeota archaeon]